MIDRILSGRNLFVLYLVLAAAYIQPLFFCNAGTDMGNSMVARHLVAFLTLTFFIVVADSELDDTMPFATVLMTSGLIYLWFLISSKMTANWWLVLAVLLASIYIIDLYDESHPKAKVDFKPIKEGIIGVALALTLVGFLIYVGEKKLDYKSDFSYATLLLGTKECKRTPNVQSYWKSLEAAFKDVSRPAQRGGALAFETMDQSTLEKIDSLE
jgi:hypothetical protein